MKFDKVKILGTTYSITYCDKPSDVDIYHHESLWGQIDYWTRTIRVYSAVNDQDTLHILIHEILHGIVEALKIRTISKADDYEDVLELLALAISDVLKSNDWLKE